MHAGTDATRLEVRGLSRAFGRVRALDNVSFSVSPGEIVGLIGPNGSGKSTLMQCVAGLDAPDAGTIRVGGIVRGAVERRREVFFLPDGITPWRDQRASWVVDFVAEHFGALPAARQAAGEALGIAAFAGRRIGELSKGERKRVALTLALLIPRTVILVDEPFDGLDPRQARAMAGLLRARAAAGGTVVLSIHAMDEAERTCDRHLLLHEGRLVGDGTLVALREQAGAAPDARLEEVFLALT